MSILLVNTELYLETFLSIFELVKYFSEFLNFDTLVLLISSSSSSSFTTFALSYSYLLSNFTGKYLINVVAYLSTLLEGGSSKKSQSFLPYDEFDNILLLSSKYEFEIEVLTFGSVILLLLLIFDKLLLGNISDSVLLLIIFLFLDLISSLSYVIKFQEI